jgi:PhnB protein
MTKIVPYLSFAGNCEEAFNFYKECLNGEITNINYYEGSPMEVPEEFKKKILHITLQFENCEIMAADATPEQPFVQGNNVAISINLDDNSKAEKYFKNLSNGANIIMPFADTFWDARFGMLVDKFGINWMVNCEIKK